MNKGKTCGLLLKQTSMFADLSPVVVDNIAQVVQKWFNIIFFHMKYNTVWDSYVGHQYIMHCSLNFCKQCVSHDEWRQILCWLMLTLGHEQNGLHFVDGTLNLFPKIKFVVFLFDKTSGTKPPMQVFIPKYIINAFAKRLNSAQGFAILSYLNTYFYNSLIPNLIGLFVSETEIGHTISCHMIIIILSWL